MYIMKKVLCIFNGLTRTFKKTYENILENLILNNEKDYEFTFLINTQDLTPEMKTFFETHLNKNNHRLKDIIDYTCKSNVKSSLHIFFLRLYESLKKEQNEKYDMYINLRCDIILNKPINLNNYSDSFYFITGDHFIDNSFHNKDWDLMWLGDSNNYKTFVYFLLNKILKFWYNENIKEFVDDSIKWIINENHNLTADEIQNIRDKTGLELKSDKFITQIIHNLLSCNGRLAVSEKYENVYVKIIREEKYSKAF
jgi:hypothetical protein